jgi:hypothetical protein
MRTLLVFTAAAAVFVGCQDTENFSEEFTGNETVYPLAAGSDYAISGTVTLKERKNGSTSVLVQLTGLDGRSQHPVHLHLGNLGTPNADIAALLSPIKAPLGRSETIVEQLADETSVRYTDLKALDACIKVHLSDTGEGRDIILVSGNIGAAFAKAATNGRTSNIANCKSE